MAGAVRIMPVEGMGEVQPGDDLAAVLLTALAAQQQSLQPGDVLVVAHKVVSKAEGRIVRLREITDPSPFAHTIAAQARKDARYQEVVLRESRRIVRMDRGVLIAETHTGLICANAGVDESNVAGDEVVLLLPEDADQSARLLRAALLERAGVAVAVIIADSFGRPWREGQTNVAIGVAGMDPLVEYAGTQDPYGYTLEVSALAVGDELAGAAELVMGKVDQVPAAVIRGFAYTPAEGSVRRLLRNPMTDLFR
jgi:coenzyme F420-0:L-glutamate ligase/coenzyme F420-1:gamma-L-glutamate ligase